MGSCKEVSQRLMSGSPNPSTVSLSPTAYKSKAAASNAERLSAFYANASYDFYGTPSGALCIYKNGDAWPVRPGPESQRIIRGSRCLRSSHAGHLA